MISVEMRNETVTVSRTMKMDYAGGNCTSISECTMFHIRREGKVLKTDRTRPMRSWLSLKSPDENLHRQFPFRCSVPLYDDNEIIAEEPELEHEGLLLKHCWLKQLGIAPTLLFLRY